MKAGDPLADITLYLAIAKLITGIRHLRTSIGATPTIDHYASFADCNGDASPTLGLAPPACFTISYVDDLTNHVDFPSRDTKSAGIATIATATQTVAHKHHFAINAKPGKAEARLHSSTPTTRRLRNESRHLGDLMLAHPPDRIPTPHTMLRFTHTHTHTFKDFYSTRRTSGRHKRVQRCMIYPRPSFGPWTPSKSSMS